jgi:hypothetical protein
MTSAPTFTFAAVPEKSSDKCSVWHYFLQRSDREKAKCKLCIKATEIATAGGSTSGLSRHLLAKHNIDLKSKKSSSCSDSEAQSNQKQDAVGGKPEGEHDVPSGKRSRITQYFRSSSDVTMAVRVTRLVAVDGLSLRVLSASQDIRAGLMALNCSVPKNPRTIRQAVLTHIDDLRQSYCRMFRELLEKDARVSVTLDEWTSVANRRYLNVTVRQPQQLPPGVVDQAQLPVRNLGLVRLRGSATAEVLKEALKNKLLIFGIDIQKDVVACTSDGAAVMVKMSKLIGGPIGQLCFAHAVHNAICAVLYKSAVGGESVTLQHAVNLDDADTLTTTAETASIDDDSENEADGDDDGAFEISMEPALSGASSSSELDMEKHDLGVISQVRRIVKLFKRSPTRNEKSLQKYVVEEHGKELALQLDCKTRWNSVCTMLERFLLLEPCIKKALIDLRIPYAISARDVESLKTLVDCLKPVVLSVEAMCRRDATLLSADAAIQFLLGKLDKCNCSLAIFLTCEVKERLAQRRTSTSTLLQVLHDANYTFEFEALLGISKPSIVTLKRLIKSMVLRLFYNREKASDEDVTVVGEQPSTSTSQLDLESLDSEEIDDVAAVPSARLHADTTGREMDLEAELETAITKAVASVVKTQTSSVLADNLDGLINKEWSLHISGGGRGRILQKLYEALLTIPPTSVESERVFSAAGCTVSALRTRLGDEMVDALSFARSHYTATKQK